MTLIHRDYYFRIMGKNIFSVGDAVKYYHVVPTNDQIKIFTEVAFPENILRQHENTHILTAVFPLSIMDIKKIHPDLFHSPIGGWYKNEKFANIKDETGWYLVPKDEKFAISRGEIGWRLAPKAYFSQGIQPVIAQVMVYTMIGYYKSASKLLFADYGDRYLCCSDTTDSGGRHIGVRFNTVCGFEGEVIRCGCAISSLGPTFDPREPALGLLKAG